MVQGELFREESGIDPQIGHRKSSLGKFQFTLGLDKVLLFSIAIMFVFTLSYSFGVEHGKRVMEKKIESLLPVQTQTFTQTEPLSDSTEAAGSETVLMVNAHSPKFSVESPVDRQKTDGPAPEGPTGDLKLDNSPLSDLSKPLTKNETQPKPPSKGDLKKLGNFTVQLVTYNDKTLAEKEITRLKSKGYDGFIIPSGRYYQVCANYFENKSNARSHLEELKQAGRYPDAYIRPVLR